MTNKTEKKNKRVRLPLKVWLGYLVVATLIFSAASLAFYTKTSSSTDVARVAKFSVDATQIGDYTRAIEPGFTNTTYGEYNFKVENNSEVSVKYTIELDNLPNNMKVVLCVGESEKELATKGDARDENGIPLTGSLSFSDSSQVLGFGEARLCKLKFIALNEVVTRHTFGGITINVVFEQID